MPYDGRRRRRCRIGDDVSRLRRRRRGGEAEAAAAAAQRPRNFLL